MHPILDKLRYFWNNQGCTWKLPYDKSIAAATFHPSTIFGALSNTKEDCCYYSYSRRTIDGRLNSQDRLHRHLQFQVIIHSLHQGRQPRQEYLSSLDYIGITTKENAISFLCNNWENTSIGAYGQGWEVMCNSVEITQITYFRKMGDIPCPHPIVEITYGIERILGCLKDNPMTLREIEEVEGALEQDYSAFLKDTSILEEIYTIHGLDKRLEILQKLIEKKYLWVAYDHMLETCEYFNMLDTTGKINQILREKYIIKIRKITNHICTLHTK